MNGAPIVWQLRESIDKWDYIKLKSFYTAKEIVTRLKKQNRRKYLPATHLTRD
jgi:hypothetical protein